MSPSEPASMKCLGRTSSLPEKRGVDVLMACRGRFVGIQRKEMADLVRSVQDGRLAREAQMMAGCLRSGGLGVAVLVVEGRPRWTVDGQWLEGRTPWTIRQHRGLLWSVRALGIWVEVTGDVSETVSLCRDLEAWAGKERHSSLERRPGPVGMWGKASSREWSCHLLQSFDGIGPEIAGRMVDHFGGPPLRWTVEMAELAEVKGIGKTRARRLLGALEGCP